MNTLLTAEAIPPMEENHLRLVRQLEKHLSREEQIRLDTHHTIHGGIYTRTITMPERTVMTGALVKVNTTLVFAGVATAYVGGRSVFFDGYGVIPALAGRKQAFVAHSETHITMMFATEAKSVREAEEEFTDETDMLVSRSGNNTVVITGA
jgi:hypothetical protein